MGRTKTEEKVIFSLIGQKLKDYALLVKLRLNLTVVFSSIMAYLIAVEGQYNLTLLGALSLGGFLVTGAANTLNQVLEKDFDIMMARTANRPLAAGRMSVSEGVIAAGIMSVLGVSLLATINPITALLGMMALISYAFLYTPLKRVGTIAVFVGAIPGALPTMIGVVAADGNISTLSIALFSLQFLWQLPHFWAIGWLAFDDYNHAGFKFLKAQDRSLGLQATIYALLLLPIVWMPYLSGRCGIYSAIFCTLASVVYTWFGWNLYKSNDRPTALQLMFSSFFYLPFVLFAFYFDKIV